MTRKHHPLTLDGVTYKLRLTRAGQRNLRARFNEPPLETALSAYADEERMCALLTEALSWPDSGNAITDGEELYDLLVDCGYAGPEQFAALALDIAAVSGLMTAQQVQITRKQLMDAVNQAYATAEPGENPTTGRQP